MSYTRLALNMAPFVALTTMTRVGKRVVASPYGWLALAFAVLYFQAITTVTVIIYVAYLGDVAMAQAFEFNRRFSANSGLYLVLFHHAVACAVVASTWKWFLNPQ